MLFFQENKLMFFQTITSSLLYTYSGPCQTSMTERFEKQLTAITIFASCNYMCNISFSSPLVREINMIFLMQVRFSLQKSLYNVKKVCRPGSRSWGS